MGKEIPVGASSWREGGRRENRSPGASIRPAQPYVIRQAIDRPARVGDRGAYYSASRNYGETGFTVRYVVLKKMIRLELWEKRKGWKAEHLTRKAYVSRR
jgi:hypothetical protein